MTEFLLTYPFTFADCGLTYGNQEQPGSGQKESGAVNKFHDDQHKYGMPEEGNGFVRCPRVLVPTQTYGDNFFEGRHVKLCRSERRSIYTPLWARCCTVSFSYCRILRVARSTIRYLNHDPTHWLIVLIVSPEACGPFITADNFNFLLIGLSCASLDST